MAKSLALPKIVGHRGAAASAPENTLVSIKRAFAEGARWVEFDAKLTGDGHAILMHDETLDRTTNGTGRVRDLSLDQIRQVDAGAWFDAAFAGERVPTLVAALDLLASLGMGFNLEIKPCPGRARETARVVLATVRKHWPDQALTPIISSFQVECLATAQEEEPDLPRGFITEKLAPDWLGVVTTLGCRTVHPGSRHLTKSQLEAVKAAGYGVLVWTVNDPARARTLMGWGADGLITDDPKALVAAL